MKFHYFTYFLNPIKQGQLFPDKRSKKEILSSILSQNLEYSYRKSRLAYVFVRQDGDYIIARLGRKSSIKKSLPPEEKFRETHEEHWPHCELLFNLSEDSEKGQKIAFEYRGDVFQNPLFQLRGFAEELNIKLFGTGYLLSINPVTIEQKFWELVKRHENKIQKLTLIFNTPNLFDLKNKLSGDLKDIQKTYSATRTSIALENTAGSIVVPENADLIKQGVDYIRRGGGEYHLHIRGKGLRVIKSTNNTVTKSFDELEVNLKTENKDELLKTLEKIIT